MNIIEKYYYYNYLPDHDKGAIILEMLHISSFTIYKYKRKLNYYNHEDFYEDIAYAFVKIYTKQYFKFDFYEDADILYQTIMNNKKEKQYYTVFINRNFHNLNNIYSKSFIHSIYNDYKIHLFFCKMKSYLNHVIYNIYVKYWNKKNKHNSFVEELSDFIESNYQNYNFKDYYHLEVLYLNDDERHLISNYLDDNKILTIKELSNKTGINIKTLYRKINQIRKKIYQKN